MADHAEGQWPPYQRFTRWRHRRTPYHDVPPFSPYRRRYAALLPPLRAASHYPVIRAQTRRPDRLESIARYRLRIPEAALKALSVGAWLWLGRPPVRDVVYCVDCGAEARARGFPNHLVGPLSDRPCRGRPDGSPPLAGRSVGPRVVHR